MKTNKGFILIECIISMTIIIIILSSLNLSFNIFKRFNEDNKNHIELSQQYNDIKKHIQKSLSNSDYIQYVKDLSGRKIDVDKLGQNEIHISSIGYLSENNINEIRYSKSHSKVFIKSQKQTSGYEIGAYVDNISVKSMNYDTYIDVFILLSKDDVEYNNKFRIYMKNFEEV